MTLIPITVRVCIFFHVAFSVDREANDSRGDKIKATIPQNLQIIIMNERTKRNANKTSREYAEWINNDVSSLALSDLLCVSVIIFVIKNVTFDI